MSQGNAPKGVTRAALMALAATLEASKGFAVKMAKPLGLDLDAPLAKSKNRGRAYASRSMRHVAMDKREALKRRNVRAERARSRG